MLIVVLGILAAITIVCTAITVICVVVSVIPHRLDVDDVRDIALAQAAERDKKEEPLKERAFIERQVDEMLKNNDTTVEGLPPTIIYL